MKKFIAETKEILSDYKDLFNVIRKCGLTIVMLVITVVLLTMDQGEDIIRGIGVKYFSHYVEVNFLLLLFAIQIWFSARIALLFSAFLPNNPDTNIKIQNIIPRMLGFIVYILFGWIFYKFRVNGFKDKGEHLLQLAGFILPSFLGFLSLIKGAQYGIDLINKNRMQDGKAPMKILNYNNDDGIHLSDLSFYELTLLFAPIVVFIFEFTWTMIFKTRVAPGHSPIAIMFIGLYTWAGMITIVSYWEKTTRVPWFILFIVWQFICSYHNNDHAVRTLDTAAKRENIDSNFVHWLRADTNRKTIIMVAAEGGGSRAAYWTGSVLCTLDKDFPGFTRDVYCISSVSGSAVAAAAFDAMLREKSIFPDQPMAGKTMINRMQNFVHHDYLSSLLAALFFTDIVQHFVPFKLPFSEHFDRANYLEQAWERSWKDSKDKKTNKYFPFDSAFTSLWAGDTMHRIPSLIMNGTHVETGRPAITSNLMFDTNWDEVNILNYTKNDMRLSTAALMAARFPYFTPGGLVNDTTTVADGGYYDNSGLTSIAHLYAHFKDQPMVKGKRFVILMIRNGRNTAATKDISAYEILTPPRAFLNAWDIRTEQETVLFHDVIRHYGGKDILVDINLHRPKNTLDVPLGWYFSDESQANMNKCVDSLPWHPGYIQLRDYLKSK